MTFPLCSPLPSNLKLTYSTAVSCAYKVCICPLNTYAIACSIPTGIAVNNFSDIYSTPVTQLGISDYLKRRSFKENVCPATRDIRQKQAKYGGVPSLGFIS
jgi:hypothetical protein